MGLAPLLPIGVTYPGCSPEEQKRRTLQGAFRRRVGPYMSAGLHIEPSMTPLFEFEDDTPMALEDWTSPATTPTACTNGIQYSTDSSSYAWPVDGHLHGITDADVAISDGLTIYFKLILTPHIDFLPTRTKALCTICTETKNFYLMLPTDPYMYDGMPTTKYTLEAVLDVGMSGTQYNYFYVNGDLHWGGQISSPTSDPPTAYEGSWVISFMNRGACVEYAKIVAYEGSGKLEEVIAAHVGQ